MEHIRHECKENICSVRIDCVNGRWGIGNPVRVITYCPFCAEKLSDAQAQKIATIREWLDKQRSPICCMNMLEFESILNQVEADGFRALSPGYCRIYQDLAKFSGAIKESPDPQAPWGEYCRFWSSDCVCPRRPFSELPLAKIEVNREELEAIDKMLWNAHSLIMDKRAFVAARLIEDVSLKIFRIMKLCNN